MKKTSLAELIMSLSTKETKEVQLWLNSPVHNQRTDIIKMYNTILNTLPNWPSREEVFAEVEPNNDYDDAKMRQWIYFLKRNIEGYIIYRDLMNDDIEPHIRLVQALGKRGLQKNFNKQLKSARTKISSYPYRNHDYFNYNFLLEQEYFNQLQQRRFTELNLVPLSERLDERYFANKLRIACIMRSHQNIYNTVYDYDFIDVVIQQVEASGLLDHVAIAAYYHSYLALSHPDEETHFFQLKEMLNSTGSQLPTSELRDIYVFAINYCINRLNEGQPRFNRELVNLYRFGLTANILIDGAYISRFTFVNIVTNSLLEDEFDWVRHFIEDYSINLRDDYRENILNYCWGVYYFFRKEYDKAAKHLNTTSTDDPLIAIRARSYLVKMYYEEGEWSILESSLATMRTYLNRKGLLSYHKTSFKNFIKFTNKLTKLYSNDAKKATALATEITATSYVMEREWLLEKIKEF